MLTFNNLSHTIPTILFFMNTVHDLMHICLFYLTSTCTAILYTKQFSTHVTIAPHSVLMTSLWGGIVIPPFTGRSAQRHTALVAVLRFRHRSPAIRDPVSVMPTSRHSLRSLHAACCQLDLPPVHILSSNSLAWLRASGPLGSPGCFLIVMILLVALPFILLWDVSHLQYLVHALASCILHSWDIAPTPDITNTKCSGRENFFEYLEMGDL